MGICSHSENQINLSPKLSRSHFKYLQAIGKGAYGKIWRVEKRSTGKLYALKEMSKARIVFKRSVNAVLNEQQLLSRLNSPFLVNIYYAFQDVQYLYLVLDLLEGGDLRYHMNNHHFTEVEATCIILGLEYLHVNGILHRDIKPENLVLDKRGSARIWSPENFQDTSGTPGYIAPEVVCRRNHGIAVDYFAVGVIAYEFMMGKRPYEGITKREIKEQIILRQITVKKSEIPAGWTLEAADFINKCLQRKAGSRLGVNGPAELKKHYWFQETNWEDIAAQKVTAPYYPSSKDNNFDLQKINEEDSTEFVKMYRQIMEKEDVQGYFNIYYFDHEVTNRKRSGAKENDTGPLVVKTL